MKLKYLCSSFSTSLTQGDVKREGTYAVYGAAGVIGYMENFACDVPYISIIKDGAGIGRTNLCNSNTSLLGTLAYIIPNKNVNITWLKYVIDGLDLSENVDKTTIPHIYFSDYGDRSVTYVEPEEQLRIANFLNQKCAAIDSAVEKTRESIEEYKKLKQAVITEAVTKGIRGNYSNQMSDNAWFSEIPSNWEMRKLKYLFSIKKNIAGKEGYTVLSITQKGIVPKNISKNEGQLAQDYSNYQLLEIGDFAMNHMDLLTGWVDISKYDGVTSPDYRVFILNDNENNSPEYYLRFMQMCYFNKIFYGLGQGVSGLGRWRLQADKFLNFVVPVPPVEEQLEIAEYLDVKCTEIDNIVSKKEQYLVELEAYKKSLIYEYVTGKKEVPAVTQVEEIIDYPYFPAKYNAKSSRFAQAILMSKILDENCDNMGRVKLEKILYTIENSIGFDFDTEYVRDVAGPFDSSIYDCEGIISRKNKWFVIDESGRGVSYNTAEKKDTYKKYYMKYFSEYDAEIQRIIDLYSNYTTDKAEIIATLFAAWNDAIIDNKIFTDEDIVNDVLNNWHDKKKRFSKDIWKNAVVEMQENNLVPKGYGKHTVKKEKR